MIFRKENVVFVKEPRNSSRTLKFSQIQTVYYLIFLEFFNNRENPDFTEDNTKIRFNSWYLFGVDYMSN